MADARLEYISDNVSAIKKAVRFPVQPPMVNFIVVNYPCSFSAAFSAFRDTTRGTMHSAHITQNQKAAPPPANVKIAAAPSKVSIGLELIILNFSC